MGREYLEEIGYHAYLQKAEETLKPCPFCGKPGRIVKGFVFPIAVGCDTPICHNYIGKDSRGYETEEEATEAWNTRVYDIRDLKKWAFNNMEGCDEPEFQLFTTIYDATTTYLKEIEE